MKKPLTIRKRLGLTQEEFANILDIDRSLFAYYESGTRSLSLSALHKLGAMEIALTSLTAEEIIQSEWSQEREKSLNEARERLRNENRIRKNKLEFKLAELRAKETQLRLKQHFFSKLLKKAEEKDSAQTKEKLVYTLNLHKIQSEIPSVKAMAALEWECNALKGL